MGFLKPRQWIVICAPEILSGCILLYAIDKVLYARFGNELSTFMSGEVQVLRSSSLNIMFNLPRTLYHFGISSTIRPRPVFEVVRMGVNFSVISTEGLLSPKIFEFDVTMTFLSGICTGKKVSAEALMDDSTTPVQSLLLYEFTRIELMVVVDHGL